MKEMKVMKGNNKRASVGSLTQEEFANPEKETVLVEATWTPPRIGNLEKKTSRRALNSIPTQKSQAEGENGQCNAMTVGYLN